MVKEILKMERISKSFPGVKALDDVHLRIFSGEVMALLGENGAGKSTLMKILSGVYKMDSGNILLNNNPLDVKSPRDGIDKGISIIHQELNLIPELTIGENIFLGREPKKISGRINWKQLYSDSEKLLKELNLDLNTREKVRKLSIGHQQMVEIARALSLESDILILDEPTDALTDNETDSLFEMIDKLRKEGKALVYISHRLKEVFRICDRATILRDGQFIGEEQVSKLDEDKIIEMMVGRKLEDQFPYEKPRFISESEPAGHEIILKAENLNNSVVKNINFSIKKGEVLGLAGLMGSGRTELALTLFGKFKTESGTIFLDGEEKIIRNPGQALRDGISYVSEDRKQLGLFTGLSVRDNMTISVLKRYEQLFFRLSENSRNKEVDSYINDLSIKTPSRNQIVKNLSGGNQQKVSIASALIAKPKLLILDEPTRGVDVGAKKEIYSLINKLKQKGLGILMISSEMPEILGICDRVAVMHEGTIEKIYSREEANQENIMRSAVGLKEK